ncbi:VOC family protein [Kitasatospora sp. CB02891]|uniref:VOC family protein n=1 Tax=Kitasatospora sp. CB02891 TaxID=2020329 RepID=UPI0012FD9FB2|nr:lactoylglutathione lyase [Kitasatospora sp. CB02891]
MSVPRRPANPERWFRTRPDSSALPRPRLLARSLIDVRDLDDHLAFYERLLGVPADLRMPIPDFGGLELAAVGNLLLIASERPFTAVQRQTAYSLIVPSLDRQLALLDGTGTTLLEPPEPILPGARARVRYPDGMVAELVEHRPWKGEEARPSEGRDGGSTDPHLAAPRLLVRRAVHDDDFPGAVRLYETLLQTSATAAPELTGPRRARTAIVGNLLLVGLAAVPSAPQPQLALITPAGEQPTSPAPGTAGAVVLPGPVTAELWSEHLAATREPLRPPTAEQPDAAGEQRGEGHLAALPAGADTRKVED